MTSRLFACLALLLFASAAAHAREPSPSRHLSTAERDTALQSIKNKFDALYVFPEVRPAIRARLQQARGEGRYDTHDAAIFAERVSADLKAASHDGHAWLRFDPAQYTAAIQPAGSDAGEEAFWRRHAIRSHHGLKAMRVLPGNLRYLRIAEFEWVRDETGSVYDDAVRFLKDGDAVIIDLRSNPGGSPAAVRYLVSHFLDADTLESTFLEGSEPPFQSRTLDHLPAGRLKGKPLFVLIDGNVASAAEAFAYDVQQFKLGELIGSTTAGAANSNMLVPIAPGFILSVSHGRPVHPVSHGNWEGVGITPTITADYAQALDIAQARALAHLLQAPGTSPAQRAEYRWALDGVRSRLATPEPIAPALLTAQIGHYGPVEVDLRDGFLQLTRPNRAPSRLLPMATENLFEVEGFDDLRVRFDGNDLYLLSPDETGSKQYAKTTQSPH